MSLALDEFHRGVKTLAPGSSIDARQAQFDLAFEGAKVRITYEPLETATLGKLLSLPRAKVSIVFDDLREDKRQAFLDRFDKAFQRGGG